MVLVAGVTLLVDGVGGPLDGLSVVGEFLFNEATGCGDGAEAEVDGVGME